MEVERNTKNAVGEIRKRDYAEMLEGIEQLSKKGLFLLYLYDRPLPSKAAKNIVSYIGFSDEKNPKNLLKFEKEIQNECQEHKVSEFWNYFQRWKKYFPMEEKNAGNIWHGQKISFIKELTQLYQDSIEAIMAKLQYFWQLSEKSKKIWECRGQEEIFTNSIRKNSQDIPLSRVR